MVNYFYTIFQHLHDIVYAESCGLHCINVYMDVNKINPRYACL